MDEKDYKTKDEYNNRVAYFDSWLKAWIENRMEKDKQILTLSALGLGLLVGILDNLENNLQFFFWFFAAFAFIIALIWILLIFGKNADYIKTLLDQHQEFDLEENNKLGEDAAVMTKKLARMTKFAFGSFIFGSIMTAILTISQSGIITVRKDRTMNPEKTELCLGIDSQACFRVPFTMELEKRDIGGGPKLPSPSAPATPQPSPAPSAPTKK